MSAHKREAVRTTLQVLRNVAEDGKGPISIEEVVELEKTAANESKLLAMLKDVLGLKLDCFVNGDEAPRYDLNKDLCSCNTCQSVYEGTKLVFDIESAAVKKEMAASWGKK